MSITPNFRTPRSYELQEPPDNEHIQCISHEIELEWDVVQRVLYCPICRSIEQGTEHEICQVCGESLVGNGGVELKICPKCQNGAPHEDEYER